ncbi:MAG: hypothetical protein FIB06_01650 [Betaproteobacteria bacterium]|nr:hypothetical protein [Betaproteobacteria bacterium]
MERFGLFPAQDFRISTGGAAEGTAAAQALWYFRDEIVAIPGPGVPVAGYAPELPVVEDVTAWAACMPFAGAPDYPPLVWLGAPAVLRDAALADDASTVTVAGHVLPLRLVPRLPLNKSWFDASSAAFFCGRPAKLRGFHEQGAFVARTLWPQDFRIPEAPGPLSLAAEPAAVRAWVRALPRGGADAPFSVASAWRRPGAAQPLAGRPVLAAILNGAQGDDDESHGGHFALVTGRIGAQGAIDDWLVNNFYTLDAESEKGILAAPVPLDNYLGDLNAGQAWYRPSVMVVAVLREERVADRVQSALGRVYNQFYRHRFAYQHARANCAGISITTLRSLGWQVPERGPESWAKAIPALPLVTLKEGSLKRGKAVFDYLTEDRTRLYPAAAFEEVAADLLRLAAGRVGHDPSSLEQVLAGDIDEILLVRLPQFPSSRAWGDWPVDSSSEYRGRVPRDPAEHQIIPVAPRPFPPALRDPRTPREPLLRSDVAVIVWAVGLLLLLLFLLRRLWA